MLPRGAILVLFALSSVRCDAEPSLNWWKNAVIYQVYPRSFKDSGNDGIGDIKGIISQLPYISSLGVDAIWLNPIYPSPNADFGYDIKEYQNVNPEYGTLDDFDELIFHCRNLSLRVIMDFVPNHSSDQHIWFKKSIDNDPRFKDFYIWRKPKSFTKKEPNPPNNWLSSMGGGSAWKYDETRKQFYLHQFLESQPDLNYANKLVLKAMLNNMRFWLDKGVNGFRMDAVDKIFESQTFKDEPLIKGMDPKNYDSYNHIYTTEQPETFEVLRKFRELLDEYTKKDNDTRVMFVEDSSDVTDVNVMKKYYGDKKTPIAHFPMNFFLMSKMSMKSGAADWKKMINYVNDGLKGYTVNWVMGNHDNHRVVSPFRFTEEYVDLVNIIDMSLNGVVLTYNGEELGVEDSFVRRDEGKDPVGLRADPKDFLRVSRDPERGPFPWNSQGGFTVGKPWLPQTSKLLTTNAETEAKSSWSHLHVYKSLVNLKKSHTVKHGNVKIQTWKDVLIIFRSLEDSATIISLINFGSYEETLDLKKIRFSLPNTLHVLVASVNIKESWPQSLNTSSILLLPKSGGVLTNMP